MSRIQDLAQSILGYGKKSVDTYKRELPITQEITNRYTPQVALGAQLAGGEAQTPVRMASEFLKQRNLPGQSIVEALAGYSENTPVKQASIKAYQGEPLTAQEQALLTENALQLVVGMNEPIKTGDKIQSLLKNRGVLQSGTPEKQIQWMSDLADAEQTLPSKVLKQIKSTTIPGSERTSAILQALEEIETTPKAIEQALKIKSGETIGDFQSRVQNAKGFGLLADYDKAISGGKIQEAQNIAQRIMNDPRYIKYHGEFQDRTGINLLQQLKTAMDLGNTELQQLITDKIRNQSVKGINATQKGIIKTSNK